MARVAVRVVTALGADQLVIHAASDQTSLTEDDVWLAETIVAGGALVAIAGFAAFVAIDAFDRHIIRWTGDAAMLIFRTDRDARIHAHVAEFARVFTFQRRAGSAIDTALACAAILARTAFLARALAAEEAGRAVGRTGAAIGWVFPQVDAFAVTTGQPFAAIGPAWAAETHIDADAVAALIGLGIATCGAADNTGRLAGAFLIALRAVRTVGRATAFRAIRRRDGRRTANFLTFAGRNALAADAGLARIADHRLARAVDARGARIAIGEAGTAE